MFQDRLLDLSRQADYFWALLPEIVLALCAMGVLLWDVLLKGNRSEASRPVIAWAAVGSLVLAGVANLTLIPLMEVSPTGMVAVDTFRVFANFLFLLSGALAILLSFGYLDRKGMNRGEFHVLILFAVLGMMLMAGARDLILTFIGLEVMSVAVYVLVGFDRQDPRSAEGALKYFLLGAFSSAFFLYGIALLFGATGSTHLAVIASAVVGASEDARPMVLAGAALLVVGLGFKVAAIPFHVWTPDAYDGAPTPVTALMATGVKAAAFATFIRVFPVGLAGIQAEWAVVVWWLAVLTMLGGNLVALTQGSLKRMLAYSSIAHAGYLLVALVSGTASGAAAFLFYLLVYTLMTAGAFGILVAGAGEGTDRVRLEEYAGFGWERPFLGAAFTVFLLSLAGFPLTAGFLGKLYILRTAVEGGQQTLAVILVLASLISYFYYLRVIVVMYMQPASAPGVHQGAYLPRPAVLAVGVAAAAVLLLFFVPFPLEWARESAAGLYGMAG